MKFQVVSDLHVDFRRDHGGKLFKSIPVLANTLVLAGDLFELRSTFRNQVFDQLCARWKNVIYVLGNHEYYGCSPDEAHELVVAQEARHPNLHWLHDSSVTIEGQRFVGATLWFPDLPFNATYEHHMGDFRYIRKFREWVYLEHDGTRRYLAANLEPTDVVVTHHLPHPQSIDRQYAKSALNCFFLGDVSDLIAKYQPRVWVHGHTHLSCDYRVGVTRVVCNPHGYPMESCRFDYGFTLEVPGGEEVSAAGGPDPGEGAGR